MSELQEAKRRIVAFFKKMEREGKYTRYSMRQVCDLMELDHTTAYGALRKLKEDGVMTNTGKRHGSRWYLLEGECADVEPRVKHRCGNCGRVRTCFCSGGGTSHYCKKHHCFTRGSVLGLPCWAPRPPREAAFLVIFDTKEIYERWKKERWDISLLPPEKSDNDI